MINSVSWKSVVSIALLFVVVSVRVESQVTAQSSDAISFAPEPAASTIDVDNEPLLEQLSSTILPSTTTLQPSEETTIVDTSTSTVKKKASSTSKPAEQKVPMALYVGMGIYAAVAVIGGAVLTYFMWRDEPEAPKIDVENNVAQQSSAASVAQVSSQVESEKQEPSSGAAESSKQTPSTN